MAASSTQFGIGYDASFELNEFGQPRIKSEIEVIKDALLFVLFAQPGNYPSLPNIGLDIKTMLYSFYDEIDCNELKRMIISQCEALEVFITAGVLTIEKTIYKKHPTLLISITGKEMYPPGYLTDDFDSSGRYLIGITFDDFHNMIFNVNTHGGV